jgi:hypothetical protein
MWLKLKHIVTWKYPLIPVSIISISFLVKVVQFFHLNPQFYYYWDWPGHIDKAQKLSWIPWHGGWDTTFWGGYSTLTYPFLTHYFMKVCLLVFPSVNSAMIFVTISAFVMLLISIYLLSARYNTNRSYQIFTYAVLVLIILTTHGKYLGSYRGLLIAGGVSAIFGLTFLIFLIISKNKYSRAIWLGLLTLTHSLSAFLGYFYLLGLLIAPYLNYLIYKKSKPQFPSQHLFALIMGAAIGSPWIIPFIDPSFIGLAHNIGTTEYLVGTFLLFLLSLKFVSKPKNITSLDLLILIIGILTLVPTKLTSHFPLNIFHGLHLYRFQLFGIMIATVYLGKHFFNQHVFSKRNAALLTTIFTVYIIIYESVPHQDIFFNFHDNLEIPTHKRLINVISITNLPENQHVIEHKLTQIPNLIGSSGLFYESSQRGLQYYEFANQNNPYTFKNGSFQNFFVDKAGTPNNSFDLESTASLLGINYLAYIDDKIPDASQSSILAGTISRTDDDEHYLVLKPVSDTPLVETISTIPKYDPRINLGTWWLDTDHSEFITDEKIDLPENINLDKPPVTLTQITPTSLTFKVNSEKPAPVIVKFTHNKYWRTTVEENSYASQVYWVTPGHMLLLAQGNVTLTWNPPMYMLLSSVLSLFTLSYCIIKQKREA